MKLYNSGKLKGMYTGPEKGGMGNSKKTKPIPLPRDITKREGSSTKMPRIKSKTKKEKELEALKNASKRAAKGMKGIPMIGRLLANKAKKKKTGVKKKLKK